jgi:hypothetical protein
LASFALLALTLPQASEIRRCAEFEGFGLLSLRDFDGLQEVSLRFRVGVGIWLLKT